MFRSFILPLLLLVSTNSFGYDLPSSSTDTGLNSKHSNVLSSLSKGVSDVAQHAKKALVYVSVSKIAPSMPQGMVDPFEFFFGPGYGRKYDSPRPKQKGQGSGFFVDLDKGYIVTNNHVVEGADEISLKLANGKTYNGKVVGRDKNTDVAVVKVSEKQWKRKGLTALVFGNSDNVGVGDFSIALGAPFGLEASISFGVVSALGRGSLNITKWGNFIQTDAAINPGNSGGPLVGMDGRVMGVNTAIYSRSGAYAGIGFAVPANLAKDIAERLINDGKVSRGRLGVGLQALDEDLAESLELPPETTGALVSKVESDSPAVRAGIEPGDVITHVRGQKIINSNDLINKIAPIKPGTKVEITLYRNGGQKKLKVTIGFWPGEEGGNSPSVGSSKSSPYGLSVKPLTKEFRNQYDIQSKNGVAIHHTERDSAAERAGLQRGDLIVSVNGKKVKSTKGFYRMLKSKKRPMLRIERSGQYFFVPLRK